MEGGWLTTGDVAALFGVNRHTVSRWADQGMLPHARTLGAHRRFDAETVRALVRKLETPADPKARSVDRGA